MGDFPVKDYWKIYLNEEAKERIREMQDHLNSNYEGRSDFLRTKLEEEKVLDLEERINRAEKDLQEDQQKLERLRRIKKEREEQDKLRDKKELLKQKQKELREMSRRNGQNKDQVRDMVEEQHLENKPPRYSDEEYLEMKRDRIERIVQKRLEDTQDLDSLVEDVERLQEQVAQLNGGRESWFMDLNQEKQEVEA